MATRFSRRVLFFIGVGVGLPALLLALLGIFLTLRISRAVEDQAQRYDSYMSKQVADAFEQELLSQMTRSIALAENAARQGGGRPEILAALQAGDTELGKPHVVVLDELTGYSLEMFNGQPVVYDPRPGGLWFVGLMLQGPDGQIMGAGGWIFDPRKFLITRLQTVIQDRLPANPRMYGGYESTRKLSFELLGPEGRLAFVRQPYDLGEARTEALGGPFEGYRIRVGVTSVAAVVLAERFVGFEVTFIALMLLSIMLAAIFGLRYTLRQVELAQLKSSFVSNVTHELKTPIALIRLAVETLEMQRYSSPAEGERFLRTIARETEKLSQLVDNILDFARLESGRPVFQLGPIDPADVVRDAVETFKPRLDDQRFKVETEIPASLPTVMGDARALNHCILNLLDNAVKYSRERREIRVSAGSREGRVTISVADRGIGIPPGDQQRVFEKFVRLGDGLIHDVKGAGLGLALVHQIMRAHHGRVELVSTPGEGSTFTLVLPVAAEDSAAPAAEAQTGS
ncbi:MAG TPA: HAMP domain-containing sensor histidine kinase [Candidatus Udaeobacter sp.]|jgi:signal transduction histidine kinase|nr:HAMP domain-containing sensor histidine kinase [Candidatus Udaeobacter sp.]